MSLEISPAWLRRLAVNTGYGLRAFFDHNNHAAPEVDLRTLIKKFDTTLEGEQPTPKQLNVSTGRLEELT